MPQFVKVAIVNDVQPGTGTVVEVNGKEIALFNANGNFYAIGNTCVHRGGPLGEGTLEGNIVTCPWHGWTYNVETGISETSPDACVSTYQVNVEGSDVKVSLE